MNQKFLGRLLVGFGFALVTLGFLGLLSGCGKKAKWEGLCAHPGVNSGMPFSIKDNFTVNPDGSVYVKTETGVVLLTGSSCVLQKK